MLQKLQKRNKDQGFTIIEVLIVLAIAGLIMLIVFLAVPALQRSARNTQRKNDASAIASAVANYINNNGGDIPNKVAGTAPDLTVGCAGGAAGSVVTTLGTTCTVGSNTETAKIGYYTISNVSFASAAPAGNVAPQPGIDKLVIYDGYTCNANNTNLNPTTTNGRTAALIYETEPTAEQCLEQ